MSYDALVRAMDEVRRELTHDENPLRDVRTLQMARIDRAKIRAALIPMFLHSEPEANAFLGAIELRIHEWMPEGFWAALDAHGNLLWVADVRPWHSR